MVKYTSGDLIDSEAKIIVNPVSYLEHANSSLTGLFFDIYPHVEREYLRYLKHNKKNKESLLGCVQYVPKDSWAMVMCDTIENKHIEAYDNSYQYIVNLFVQENGYDDYAFINMKAIKKGLENIKHVAQKLDADIAIPFKFNIEMSDSDWEKICDLVQKILVETDVEIVG